MFKPPDEDVTGAITIVEIGDPEAEIYLLDAPHHGYARSPPCAVEITAGSGAGYSLPPYVRGRNEPLFIRVRLLATKPWDGHLFIRLMNDNERVFHPLRIEAVEADAQRQRGTCASRVAAR